MSLGALGQLLVEIQWAVGSVDGASHQMLSVKDECCDSLAQKTRDAHLTRSWRC